MKKEATLLVAFVGIMLLLLVFVSANEVESILKVDNIQHRIQFVNAGNNDATLNIDDITTYKFSPVQSKDEFYPTEKVGLYFILTNAKAGNCAVNATFLIGTKKEFWAYGSESNVMINLTIDGERYTIELLSAGGGDATLRITNITGTIMYSFSEQTSMPYSVKQKGGLYFVLTDAKAYFDGLHSGINATFLIFYENKFVSYIMPCSECSNECNSINETICVDDTSYKKCGNFDSDLCFEWGNLTKCNNGEICENRICSAPQDIECNRDEDCLIEDTGMPYCKGNSWCIASGSYSCVAPGTTQSYCNLTKTNEDCTPCLDGCEDGTCKTSPTPTPTPTPSDYCENVGIRDNNKYCSIDKVWLNQKTENSICDNNFECESNKCGDRSCQGKNPLGKTILYLLIGLIAFALIMVIISFIRTSKNR